MTGNRTKVRKTKKSKRPNEGTNLDYITEDLRPLAYDIKALNKDERNAREHDARNLESVIKSLDRYKQRKPIVVNKKNNVIEAGNGTYEAAIQLGWDFIACVFVEDDEASAIGYGIADNRTAELAGWNPIVLGDLLKDLESFGEDITVTGFEEFEIKEFITPDDGDVSDDVWQQDPETPEGSKKGKKKDEDEEDENLYAVFFNPQQWEAIYNKVKAVQDKYQLDDAQAIVKLVRERKAAKNRRRKVAR